MRYRFRLFRREFLFQVRAWPGNFPLIRAVTVIAQGVPFTVQQRHPRTRRRKPWRSESDKSGRRGNYRREREARTRRRIACT